MPDSRTMKPTLSIVLTVMTGWLISETGCARSPSPIDGQKPVVVERRVLSAKDAAEFAAGLANAQCERRYRRRPFKPDQYPAILQDSRYRWGYLDVGGVGGFSAMVTFRPDGSEPQVEVYFSSDSM